MGLCEGGASFLGPRLGWVGLGISDAAFLPTCILWVLLKDWHLTASSPQKPK